MFWFLFLLRREKKFNFNYVASMTQCHAIMVLKLGESNFQAYAPFWHWYCFYQQISEITKVMCFFHKLYHASMNKTEDPFFSRKKCFWVFISNVIYVYRQNTFSSWKWQHELKNDSKDMPQIWTCHIFTIIF